VYVDFLVARFLYKYFTDHWVQILEFWALILRTRLCYKNLISQYGWVINLILINVNIYKWFVPFRYSRFAGRSIQFIPFEILSQTVSNLSMGQSYSRYDHAVLKGESPGRTPVGVWDLRQGRGRSALQYAVLLWNRCLGTRKRDRADWKLSCCVYGTNSKTWRESWESF